MNLLQYQNRCELIMPRLLNAIQHRCYRTAHARIRELARAHAEFYNLTYAESHKLLCRKYLPNNPYKGGERQK